MSSTVTVDESNLDIDRNETDASLLKKALFKLV